MILCNVRNVLMVAVFVCLMGAVISVRLDFLLIPSLRNVVKVDVLKENMSMCKLQEQLIVNPVMLLVYLVLEVHQIVQNVLMNQ